MRLVLLRDPSTAKQVRPTGCPVLLLLKLPGDNAGRDARKITVPCTSAGRIKSSAAPGPPSMQVQILHKGFDNETQAMEHAQRLAAFLRQLASSEKPGCSITTLQTEPFKDAEGQVGRQGRREHQVAAQAAQPTAWCYGCLHAAR